MLYEKIMSVHNALGVLSHKVDKEIWAVLKLARNELMDAADMAEEMESSFTVGADSISARWSDGEGGDGEGHRDRKVA